ncbi:GNAT family N-acetyltransferase [Nocardiopsis tropica]|uniref:GNAT family N-acetyltransferase n=1 Tax=Nocardiopsis tropica TaxID=109330 RepID=A0ABV2A640_9ACTN
MTSFLRLGVPQDLDAVVDTLVAAFDDYPWTRYVIPEDDYTSRLHELQHLYLKHALDHGIVAVSEHGEGVVALLPPDASEPGEATLERIITLYGDRIDRLAGADQRPVDPDDWSLETLGVHPDHQGKGLGGALIEFGLDAAGRQGARAVRLETSEERNVSLYQRYGFRVTDRSQRPGGPPVWTMRTVLDTTGAGNETRSA